MIRRFFKQEFAKLREMTFAEKRWYIWEYYKLQIIVLGFVMLFVGSMINRALNPPKQEYLYVAWLAGPAFHEDLENLARRLDIIVSEDPERYEVAVRSYFLTGDPQMDQAIITRFNALLSLGSIHVLLMSYDEVHINASFGTLGLIYDTMDALRELDRDMYDKLTDRQQAITYRLFDFIQENSPEVTETLVICLQDAPLLTELGFRTDDMYFGIVINANHPYESAKALIALFGGGFEYGQR